MKIDKIRIQNLRAFQDETIFFDDYTCLIGPNGSGKSTVLTALNIFFRENEGSSTNMLSLDIEDFHKKETGDPIEITLWFRDLSDEAAEEFQDYFRNDKLIVKSVATWDAATNKAEVKQHGVRLGKREFIPFFAQAGESSTKVADLQSAYSALRELFSDLPDVKQKQQMIDGLHEYERNHPDQCVEIPSSQQFYGWTRGANRLSKYIQWVYIPAVKDASQEQRESKDSALEKLLNRTVRSKVNFSEEVTNIREDARTKYAELLESSQAVLQEISRDLSSGIANLTCYPVHASIRWTEDQAKSVQITEPFASILAGETDALLHQIARCGHGMQRCFIIGLLNELAKGDGENSPTLILGIEEPELYQHPPQARHLATVLRSLKEGNAQVVACTHSPYFVSGEFFEEIRLVKRDIATSTSCVSATTFDVVSEDVATAFGQERPWNRSTTQAKLNQELQPELSELFFSPTVVLVEGPEDLALISTHMILEGQWESFRQHGGHIVPVGGKTAIIRPLAVANRLGIKSYVLFDSDNNLNGADRDSAESVNGAILKLVGREDLPSFPDTPVIDAQVAIMPRDLQSAVRQDLGESEWATWWADVISKYDPGVKLKKTSLPLVEVIQRAFDEGKTSETLRRLTTAILMAVGAIELEE